MIPTSPSRHSSRNGLLVAMSAADLALVEPHLNSIAVAVRHEIERPNRRIDTVYFMDAGIASVVAVQTDETQVEVGLIGPEGEPGAWRIRGMAAEPEARRRGVGSAVLGALLEHARGQGARKVWASVRVPARTLYARAGFRVTSDEFEEPHIGRHVMMELTLEQDGEAR